MNKNMRKCLTYIRMVLLLMILGAVVLWIAGKPLLTLFKAKANMAMEQGAPRFAKEDSSQVSKLVLNKRTGDESDIQVPELDTRYGTLSCDRISLNAPLYYGDSEESLLLGAGQYPNGVMPGYGKPLLVSGHDATYFAPLEKIKIGDIISLKTDSYSYYYSVSSKLVAEAEDASAYDLSQEKEQLILYTCYPFGQLVGDRSKRFFVYCDRIAAPDLE